MYRPILFLLVLLFTNSGLHAQTIRSQQTTFRDSYVAVEKLPDGRQFHLLHREGYDNLLSSEIIALSNLGDTLWVYDLINFDFNPRIELEGLILEPDSTLLTYGRANGCDIWDGGIIRLDARNGQVLANTFHSPQARIPPANNGIRLSDGNILLVEYNTYTVLWPDLTKSFSWRSQFTGCNEVVSLIPGENNDFIVSIDSDYEDCSRQTYHLRVDRTMATPVMAVLGQLHNDAPFYDYVVAENATYTYAGGQLLKLNERLEVAATSRQNGLADGIGDFISQGDGYVFVALSDQNGEQMVIRFDTVTLLPFDTLLIDGPTGLNWQDMIWANDSIRVFANYDDPQTEHTREYSLYGTAAVSWAMPTGQNFTFPNLDAELTQVTSRSTTTPIFGFCNGPGCSSPAYFVRYDSLRVTVTNQGTEVINNFYLQTRESPDCQCSFCADYISFRQHFDNVGLAPGEQREITLNPIGIDYQIGESQLCLWLTNLNHGVDRELENNIACLDALTSTESTILQAFVRLIPDRSAGTLKVTTDFVGVHTTTLYDLAGRELAQTSGTSQSTLLMPDQRGLYFVRMADGRGRSHTTKVVW